MLANNLRDLERDIENKRYTLVYYIGRPVGIKLFEGLMYTCYVALAIGLVLGIYSWPIIIAFGSLPKIYKNVQEFKQTLPEPRSFGYAIKNMVLFNSSYAAGLFLTLLWQMVK